LRLQQHHPGGNGPRVARDVAFQPGQVLAEYRRTTFQHGQRLLGKKPKYEGKGSGEPRKFVVRSREHVDQPFPPYPQSLFSDLVNVGLSTASQSDVRCSTTRRDFLSASSGRGQSAPARIEPALVAYQGRLQLCQPGHKG